MKKYLIKKIVQFVTIFLDIFYIAIVNLSENCLFIHHDQQQKIAFNQAKINLVKHK